MLSWCRQNLSKRWKLIWLSLMTKSWNTFKRI
jgi:hypothetical protein